MKPTENSVAFVARFIRTSICFSGAALAAIGTSHAQLDPEPRKLLHLGVNQSLHDDGPQAHYLFYYWNMPNVPSTNQVLRLVIAPTYVDGELGFKGILGENTDLGLSVFGGGYAYDYDEVRQGNYFRDESFEGHGGGGCLRCQATASMRSAATDAVVTTWA